MFGNGFGWPHLLIILVVVIILFGAKRLPDAARGVGKSLRIFKSEAKAMREEGQNDENSGNESQNAAENAQPGQLPQSNSGTNGSTPSSQGEKQKNDVQS